VADQTKEPIKTEDRITVRVPVGIMEALRRLSRRQERSLNGEMMMAFRAWLEQHGETIEDEGGSSRQAPRRAGRR
jgi:Arc-like DNA binding domain